MHSQIQNIIYKALQNLAEELENDALTNPNEETKIYGVDGALDSLSLVSFIADIEEMVEEELGENITLADEKAMSSQNSPFKNVSSLTQYIQNLIQK
ncbi:hypothetical protein [Helicobacter kayseriensis]|uniref:hypothetical protein n=1 Tax=Helicobacter kayseriensis TaxID=2905877 RepID=UPI001E5B20D1|nr:hypothetical protein [Helicobacter kayseriensis]MCE3046680.1 hypothetical protein [Helicobacter kayseriensis]MCE3048018.1 hypothetical protein [Helicobacter kayseriensis]